MKKWLIRLAIVVACLVAAPFLIAACMPRTYVAEREIVIMAPQGKVFAFIADLRNQSQFNEWLAVDPQAKTSHRGTPGEVGSIFQWESDNQNVGVGQLEIKALKPDERIEMEIRFQKPFVGTNPTRIYLATGPDGNTSVRQVYDGEIPYPMNLMCAMCKSAVDDGMKASLGRLKQVLEAASSSASDEE